MCGVPSVTLLTSIVGTPRLCRARAVPLRGEEGEAQAVQVLAQDGGRRLVGVADRDEDGALGGQRRAGRGLRLGEGLREGVGDRHDLAGGLHLGAEPVVGPGKAVEGHDGLFDAHVARHPAMRRVELGERSPRG